MSKVNENRKGYKETKTGWIPDDWDNIKLDIEQKGQTKTIDDSELSKLIDGKVYFDDKNYDVGEYLVFSDSIDFMKEAINNEKMGNCSYTASLQRYYFGTVQPLS